MDINIIIIIIQCIIIFFLGYIIIKKIKIIDKIQLLYNKLYSEYEKQVDWINLFSETVKVINKNLNEIDLEGSFRSDDEVGYFYQAMYSILKKLVQFEVIDEQDSGEINGEGENLLYGRSRERNRRIQQRKKPDIEIEDILNQNFKPIK